MKELDDGWQLLERVLRHSNKNRENLVCEVGRSIAHCIVNNEVSVKTELHEPFEDCGCVSVRGTEIIIRDTLSFVGCLRTADNVEIYPMTTGDFQMNLGYNGLME